MANNSNKRKELSNAADTWLSRTLPTPSSLRLWLKIKILEKYLLGVWEWSGIFILLGIVLLDGILIEN